MKLEKSDFGFVLKFQALLNCEKLAKILKIIILKLLDSLVQNIKRIFKQPCLFEFLKKLNII